MEGAGFMSCSQTFQLHFPFYLTVVVVAMRSPSCRHGDHVTLSVYSKHMNAFIEDILTRIQDLLELAPPVSVPW